jgi:hypothetical protein
MELSDNTIQLLKNFASINSNILIRQGNSINTISEAKNILASATVAESFPQEIGIYDLNEFLSVLGLVDKPRLKFNEDHVVVGDSTGRSKVRYFFSDKEMLTSPKKEASMPEADVKFHLDNDTLNRVKRAASALGHNELMVTGDETNVALTVTSSDNSTSNTFSIDVQGTSKLNKYSFVFNISNLKMLSGNYEVEISTRLISQFTNSDNSLKYWIALEKNSKYGD